MNDEFETENASETPALPRLFIREPGWRIGVKLGSERVFCYMIAPGEEAYHRLRDGEIILIQGEEKLCLTCAWRRGLLSLSPKGLRERTIELELDVSFGDLGYEIR